MTFPDGYPLTSPSKSFITIFSILTGLNIFVFTFQFLPLATILSLQCEMRKECKNSFLKSHFKVAAFSVLDSSTFLHRYFWTQLIFKCFTFLGKLWLTLLTGNYPAFFFKFHFAFPLINWPTVIYLHCLE